MILLAISLYFEDHSIVLILDFDMSQFSSGYKYVQLMFNPKIPIFSAKTILHAPISVPKSIRVHQSAPARPGLSESHRRFYRQPQ